MNDEADWDRIIRGIREGNRDVLLKFWEQYGPALHFVAEKNLSPGLKRRIGAEDVVQSVCRTFLRRAQIGQFQLTGSDDLWSLLCAITLNKVRDQTRFHLRKKRGLIREVHATNDSINDPYPAKSPTPDAAVEFAEQLEQLFNELDPEERQIVDLKLQDLGQKEIAKQLACSERTVRRIMKRVEDRWRGALS